MIDLSRHLIDVECPKCGYTFDIQMLDASCQIRRRCPCCRVSIRFVEPDGSVSGGIADVNAAFRDLAETFKRFGG